MLESEAQKLENKKTTSRLLNCVAKKKIKQLRKAPDLRAWQLLMRYCV